MYSVSFGFGWTLCIKYQERDKFITTKLPNQVFPYIVRNLAAYAFSLYRFINIPKMIKNERNAFGRENFLDARMLFFEINA